MLCLASSLALARRIASSRSASLTGMARKESSDRLLGRGCAGLSWDRDLGGGGGGDGVAVRARLRRSSSSSDSEAGSVGGGAGNLSSSCCRKVALLLLAVDEGGTKFEETGGKGASSRMQLSTSEIKDNLPPFSTGGSGGGARLGRGGRLEIDVKLFVLVCVCIVDDPASERSSSNVGKVAKRAGGVKSKEKSDMWSAPGERACRSR